MSHAGEGLLQAYVDGEMDSAAVAELDRHLVTCSACAAELAALRSVNSRAGAAMGLLQAPPATMLRARAEIARERAGTTRGRTVALGGRSLAKAAMLLLALAGAGAAAIPGSPVRRAVEVAVARVAQWLGAGETEVADGVQEVAPE